MAESEKVETPKAEAIAKDCMAVSRFVSFFGDSEVWIEKDGILRMGGEDYIRVMIEKAVPDASEHFKNEVIGHIRDSNRKERETVEGASWPFLAVANGVLDIRTSPPAFWPFEDFRRTYPDVLIFNKLPAEFKLGATAPLFLKFLRELAPSSDDRRRLLDQFASILDRRINRKQRCLMLVGDTNAGKTTFLNVEKALVGPDNVSSISLQSLTDGTDRFATSRLYTKMLNICGDLSEVSLKVLGPFKDLTGGSVVNVQRKGRDGFQMHNTAKLHFAANVPPGVKSVTDRAFWDRWDYVEVHNGRKHTDRNLLDKLTEPRELSGILNIVLGVLARQLESGFAYPSTPEENQAAWLGQAEPARGFILENLTADPNARTPKAEIARAWGAWRTGRGFTKISEQRFNELIREITHAEAGTAKIGGKAVKVWLGIKLKDSSQGELVTEVTGESISPTTTEEEEEEEEDRQKAVTSVTRGLRALFGGVRP